MFRKVSCFDATFRISEYIWSCLSREKSFAYSSSIRDLIDCGGGQIIIVRGALASPVIQNSCIEAQISSGSAQRVQQDF